MFSFPLTWYSTLPTRQRKWTDENSDLSYMRIKLRAEGRRISRTILIIILDPVEPKGIQKYHLSWICRKEYADKIRTRRRAMTIEIDLIFATSTLFSITFRQKEEQSDETNSFRNKKQGKLLRVDLPSIGNGIHLTCLTHKLPSLMTMFLPTSTSLVFLTQLFF